MGTNGKENRYVPKELRKKDGLIFLAIMVAAVILATVGMTSSTSLKMLALSFDTWTHGNVAIQCSTLERTDQSEFELLDYCSQFVSKEGLSVSHANVYTLAVDEEHNPEKFTVEYGDLSFDCAIGRLRTKTILSSKRLELYNEYALFEENHESTSGIATFITRSMADLMLGEAKETAEEYESLLGQTYQMNGGEHYVYNIIDDREEGLLGQEWKRMYGYISFVVSGALRTVERTAIVTHIKTQPYFVDAFLSECVKLNLSIISDFKIYSQDGDKSYSFNEFETGKALELMSSDIMFSPANGLSICLIDIPLIGLLAYLIKLFFFDKKTIGILRFILVPSLICISAITAVDIIAFAMLGWSYDFVLMFAFVPTGALILVDALAVATWLISLVVQKRRKEKPHGKN